MTRSEKPGARPAIGCDGADEDRPSKAPRTDQIWQDNCRSKSAAGAIGSLGIGAATATEPSEATMWALSLKRRSRTRSKIGRASGRESVCQYGYISGVAVQLKKK